MEVLTQQELITVVGRGHFSATGLSIENLNKAKGPVVTTQLNAKWLIK